MILIDNYDSFTYNIVHAFCMLGMQVEVICNQSLTIDAVLEKRPDFLVIGPGPGGPSGAGISKGLIEQATVPVLGICLGHQAIGEVFGAKVVRAASPMHGKISWIHHNGKELFKGVPSPFRATRYHSLVIEDLPPELELTAWTDQGEVMGISHKTRPLFGLQFHPESIASEEGMALLRNFCTL